MLRPNPVVRLRGYFLTQTSGRPGWSIRAIAKLISMRSAFIASLSGHLWAF